MSEADKPHFKLGKVIAESKLSMPYHNFEQLVMARLKEEAELKKSRQYILYSILSFAFFIVLGFIVSTQFTGYMPVIGQLSQQSLKLILQVAFIFCILFRAEHLIKYFKHHKLNMS